MLQKLFYFIAIVQKLLYFVAIVRSIGSSFTEPLLFDSSKPVALNTDSSLLFRFTSGLPGGSSSMTPASYIFLIILRISRESSYTTRSVLSMKDFKSSIKSDTIASIFCSSINDLLNAGYPFARTMVSIKSMTDVIWL